VTHILTPLLDASRFVTHCDEPGSATTPSDDAGAVTVGFKQPQLVAGLRLSI
jgi:hypothetical protein